MRYSTAWFSVTSRPFNTVKIKALPQIETTLQNWHLYLLFQRSRSFLLIDTLITRQNIKTYAATQNLVYRRHGHFKCLHTSNKCLLTKTLKIGQCVYTWIHFSAVGTCALPERCYWLSDFDPMLRQRHQADEQAQCSNEQPWYGGDAENSPTTLGSSVPSNRPTDKRVLETQWHVQKPNSGPVYGAQKKSAAKSSSSLKQTLIRKIMTVWRSLEEQHMARERCEVVFLGASLKVV